MAPVRKPRLIDTDGDENISAPDDHVSESDPTQTFTQALSGAGDMSRQILATGKIVQEELVAFCQQRFQSNAEATAQIMKSKTFPELLAAQQSWAKNATDQYTSYMTRMTGLVQSAMSKARETE